MDANKNIENLFRNSLGDYIQKPSEGVWNGIRHKLIGPRIEFLYKSAFKGFTAAPSEVVWRKIAAVMWVKNFIHFNPFSFNAYYMGAISIIGTGIFLSYNNNFFGSQDVIPAQRHSQIENQNFANVLDKIKPVQSIFDIENEINSNISNNTQTKYISSEIIVKENITDFKEVENKIIADEIINRTDEQEIIGDVETVESYMPASRMKKIIIPQISYSPTINDFAKQIMFNQDFANLNLSIDDTLGTDYKGDDIIIKRDYFELSGFFNFEKTTYNIVGNNPELLSQTENLINRHSSGPAYSAGLNIGYNYKSFLFETGLHYNKLSESASVDFERTEYAEDQYFEFSEYSFWTTDTLGWILDLDEYLQGNVVYIPYTDSSQVFVKDSVLITVIDSTKYTEQIDINSNYHIIAVPAIIGYEFKLGKLSLTPKTGVIAGFLIKRNGYIFSPENSSLLDVNLAPQSSVLFDALGAFNFKYHINPKISIFAEPNIRVMLNSMYDKSWAIDQKAYRFGLSAGISIRL